MFSLNYKFHFALQAAFFLLAYLQLFQFPFAASLDTKVLTKSEDSVDSNSPRPGGSPDQYRYWTSESAVVRSVWDTQCDWKTVPHWKKEIATLHWEAFPEYTLKLRSTRLSGRMRMTKGGIVLQEIPFIEICIYLTLSPCFCFFPFFFLFMIGWMINFKCSDFDGTEESNFQVRLGKLTVVFIFRKLNCGIPKMEDALAIK